MKRRNFMIAATSFPIVACSASDIDVPEWTEEVKLHDGRMIQVWRQARAKHGGFPNAPRGRNLDFALTYEPASVSWKGPWGGEPVSFELFDDVPHLVLLAEDPSYCAKKAKTDYSAQFLRWEDKQWVEVTQDQFPVERALANLYTSFWGHTTDDDARGLVTWATKAERDGFYPQSPPTVKSYFEKPSLYCNRF